MQNKKIRIESIRYLILIFLFAFTISNKLMAQDEEAPSNPEEKITLDKDDILSWMDSSRSGQQVSPLEFELTGNKQLDSAIIKSQIDYKTFAVKHFERTFTQQFYSGIFIFIMVIAIVAMGLILSFKQFKLNEEIVRHGIKNNLDTLDKGINTESSIDISKNGLKFNSAVIGLMLLIISLLFFFLYLKFVYQIEVMTM